jgi:UDPglucose--hexose-1-phosphate uridylyltransferase
LEKTEFFKEVEKLISLAIKHELINELDAIPCRNALYELFMIDEPIEVEVFKNDSLNNNEILSKLLDYARENGIIKENNTTYRDLLDSKIMGIFMPRQSEIVKNFYEIYNSKSAEAATEYFYNLSTNSNYIRMDRISRNFFWLAKSAYGDLEITINLSKPEKDPKEIAATRYAPQSNYPKCLLYKQTRKAKPPGNPRESRRRGVVFTIFTLCLLQ